MHFQEKVGLVWDYISNLTKDNSGITNYSEAQDIITSLQKNMTEYPSLLGKSQGYIVQYFCNKYEDSNNKLQAVKEVKNFLHLGLKEAKDLVDAMWE
jgi:ribosomal protein L7/L12